MSASRCRFRLFPARAGGPRASQRALYTVTSASVSGRPINSEMNELKHTKRDTAPVLFRLSNDWFDFVSQS